MNDAARAMGHYIQLGLTFVIFLGMSIWIYLKREKMSSAFPFWTKWGPFILMLGASFLVVFDPLRHVLQDFEWWPAPGSSEYRRKCHDEVFACLSPLGIWVTLVFTYSGFILMIWATMWQAQIGKKLKQIRSQWRDLRGTQSNTV